MTGAALVLKCVNGEHPLENSSCCAPPLPAGVDLVIIDR